MAMMQTVASHPVIHWTEEGSPRFAWWRSDSPPPTRVIVADDDLSADRAYDLACQGTALLWRGDYQNARQMLSAMSRRAQRQQPRARKRAPTPNTVSSAEAFHMYRQARSQRARTLGALLIPLDAGYVIPLRRGPDIREACTQAFGTAEGASVVSLRALLGVVGAHEWRNKGIEIPAAGGRIHPHFGVFAPVRHEYVDLVALGPLPVMPGSKVAFDIGTGTGVLAAVLARRGMGRVVATDRNPRALMCARENLQRLGLAQQVTVVEADLFPEGRAALVVCNPPWVPARPSSALEEGIYDFESRMLLGFLRGLNAHLEPEGEGWLIVSDLAEHLGLRSRAQLLEAFDAAGLKVVDRSEVRPVHPRASDLNDPLHAARAAEVTSLWRLAPR
jgi:ribosomal protein L11 methylase PrmA